MRYSIDCRWIFLGAGEIFLTNSVTSFRNQHSRVYTHSEPRGTTRKHFYDEFNAAILAVQTDSWHAVQLGLIETFVFV